MQAEERKGKVRAPATHCVSCDPSLCGDLQARRAHARAFHALENLGYAEEGRRNVVSGLVCG